MWVVFCLTVYSFFFFPRRIFFPIKPEFKAQLHFSLDEMKSEIHLILIITCISLVKRNLRNIILVF